MWKLPHAQRLERWKSLRTQMSGLDIQSALHSCTEFWAPAPFVPWYLDPEYPDAWPDPWTLIQENYYCSLAKALGMLYTVHLSEHGRHVNLCLRRYHRKDTDSLYNLVWIDEGKYVLNSDDVGVLNNKHITEQYRLLIELSSEELKLDRY